MRRGVVVPAFVAGLSATLASAEPVNTLLPAPQSESFQWRIDAEKSGDFADLTRVQPPAFVTPSIRSDVYTYWLSSVASDRFAIKDDAAVAIPLPAALWTGITTLGGLVFAKRVKRHRHRS